MFCLQLRIRQTIWFINKNEIYDKVINLRIMRVCSVNHALVCISRQKGENIFYPLQWLLLNFERNTLNI